MEQTEGEKGKKKRRDREREMLMKTMTRFRIPTLASLAFWEIDDERRGSILMLAEADILMLALMQRYLTWVWTAAAGIKIG